MWRERRVLTVSRRLFTLFCRLMRKHTREAHNHALRSVKYHTADARTFPLTEDSELRRELKRLLEKSEPTIEFVMKSGRRDRTLGEATLSLNDMLDSGRELVMKKLDLVQGGERIGDFVVTIKGYDAMSACAR